MRWPLVRHVFCKEGREILRDRRTIMVNVVLPVLLYPLLAMAFIQLNHLAVSGPDDWPRLAVVDGDEALLDELPLVSEGETQPEQTLPGSDQSSEPATERSADPLVRIDLVNDDAEWFRERAATLRAAEDPDPLFAETAERLRQQRLLAVIVADHDDHGRQRYTILADDAHRDYDRTWPRLRQHLDTLRQQRVRDALSARGLDSEQILDAQPSSTFRLAAASENLRVRLASIIPILLVMLALSGAFMPAIDLIAGERERGTLETLLSMPGARGDMFAGKLLVVAVAAVVNVMLNLTSLGVTTAIVGSSLPFPGSAGGPLIDPLTLLLALAMLLPLCLTLAAVCLGVAGLAASTKEAQNYLGPLFLVVMLPAMAALMPTLGPSPGLDMIPVLGPVLVVKEILQAPSIPWHHVLLATASSIAVAWVVVGWSARLLEQERFLFPGMIRAGWGIFRSWGPAPSAPGAVEALGVFAACMGCFLAISLTAPQVLPNGFSVVAAQFLGLLLPVLLHQRLGDYRRASTLFLTQLQPQGWTISLLLIPVVILLSFSLGAVQAPYIPPTGLEESAQLEEFFNDIMNSGGIPLLLLIVAVTPAICEEFLCRGTLLSGLRKSLGPIAAIVLSALIFGLMHMSPWRLFPQAILGIILAVLVLRSGSIWSAVIVHFGHNAGVVLLVLWAQEHYGTISEEELTAAHPASAMIWLAIAALCGFLSWRLLKRLPLASAT